METEGGAAGWKIRKGYQFHPSKPLEWDKELLREGQEVRRRDLPTENVGNDVISP